MSDFLVSARKYRPVNFEDVVGQQAITSTLKNAISNNKLAQALLFTGPRGVGKTSCARIVAREINNFKINDDNSYNIFELDAASNNGVEGIRNLIDQTRIPPQTGKYKVYIIDEVHMLSSGLLMLFKNIRGATFTLHLHSCNNRKTQNYSYDSIKMPDL